MGLLGGFKAKFKSTGNNTEKKSKKKKNSGDQVVCVNFKTFSEFDAPSSYNHDIPSCSKADPGKNEVIKEKKVITKPDIGSVFQPKKEENKPLVNGDARQNGTIPKVQTGNKPAAPAPPGLPSRIEERNIIERSNSTKAETPPVLPSRIEERKIIERSNSTKAETPPVLPSKIEERKITEPSTSTKVETVKTTTPVQKQEKSSISEDTDDGNFTIHITNHQQNDNLSDDEESISEDEDSIEDFSPINYSSQATSIFFGGEEEPVIMRPRNVVIDDDDEDSDGSSASA